MGGKLTREIKNTIFGFTETIVMLALMMIAFYFTKEVAIINQEIDYIKYSQILQIKNEYEYFTLWPDIKKCCAD